MAGDRTMRTVAGTTGQQLLIRADASAEIGTGHVMRCLALAQAWQDLGGTVSYASMSLPEPLRSRLVAENCAVHSLSAIIGSEDDARCTVALARSLGAQWVVLDGYALGPVYRRFLGQNGVRMLLLDDDGSIGPYEVDAVLNQNPGASPQLYATRAANTALLLGTSYAMLRRELAQREFQRVVPTVPARRLVVSMGGADPLMMTEKVLEAIQRLPELNLQVYLLVGAANPRYGRYLQLAASPHSRVEVGFAVNDLSTVWLGADLAVVAGGSTCLELCYAGVPAIVVTVAPNQESLAGALQSEGAAINLGRCSEVTVKRLTEAIQGLAGDESKRWEMIRAGQRLVDGRGASRVAEFLFGSARKGTGHSKPVAGVDPDRQQAVAVAFREAKVSDAAWLLACRNDPVTRMASHHHEPVTIEEHQAWLEGTLQSTHRKLFIAEAGGVAVGSVRFDTTVQATMISWTVAPGQRRRGFGAAMVRWALGRIPGRVVAEIKAGNAASIRIAESAGLNLERRDGDVLHFFRPPRVEY